MKIIQALSIGLLLCLLSCTQTPDATSPPSSTPTPPQTTPTIPTPSPTTPEPIPANTNTPIKTVPTGIPVFIGYTEKAMLDDTQTTNIPTRIKSLADFEEIFGKGNTANPTTPLGHYYLYESVVEFFAHGGGSCYIVSVGDYNTPLNANALTQVVANENVLEKVNEPDLIVIPDAMGLAVNDCYSVYQSVLQYCERMKTCTALFDIHGGYDKSTMDANLQSFKTGIGNRFLKYGAAYYPWFKKGDNNTPTSGAIAGLIASNDRNRGVWKAPANLSTNANLTPSIQLSGEDQQLLNVDPTTGKSINAIRLFTGNGTMIWGARTLDGNSNDWRYISVVRTTLMIQKSINNWLPAFQFEPNDANTWVKVRNSVEDFLTNIWRSGGLLGSNANNAFNVSIGLNKTMTENDIFNNLMKVEVAAAFIRPAEFMMLSFEQTMANN